MVELFSRMVGALELCGVDGRAQVVEEACCWWRRLRILDEISAVGELRSGFRRSKSWGKGAWVVVGGGGMTFVWSSPRRSSSPPESPCSKLSCSPNS